MGATISWKPRQVDIELAHDSTLHQYFSLTAAPSYPPALKRLISKRPAQRGRIPLITTIFADRNEVEVVKQLCGDDAQIFVDLVDEVSLCGLSPIEHKRINSHLNVRALSVRCWTILTRS